MIIDQADLAFTLAHIPGRVDSSDDVRNLFWAALGKADEVANFNAFGRFDPLSSVQSRRERIAASK